MALDINLDNLKDENGGFSESDVKVLEKATGMEWKDIHAQVQEQNTETPEGNPRKWSVKEKNEYIDANGRDAWQKLLQSRKAG